MYIVNASSHSLSSRFLCYWACSMKAQYKLITRSKEQYKQYQREELKNSSVFYFWEYLMVPSRKMAITFVHYIYRLPCSSNCLQLDRNPISGQVNCMWGFSVSIFLNGMF